jgi:hypothetical protein
VLAGDFNKDVYRGEFSERLAKDDPNMTEQIPKTTGIQIPPTHDRVSMAMCVFLITVGV